MTSPRASRPQAALPERLPAVPGRGAHGPRRVREVGLARLPRRPGPARRAAAAALLALAAACAPEIQGSGVFHEETRSVPPFVGVRVDDPLSASISIGPKQSVRVSGDANVVTQLETEVHIDPLRQIAVLELRVTDHFTPVHPLRVDVTVPELRLLHAEDAATVTADGVKGAALEVEASDGSLVTLAGPGGALLEATLSGGTHPGASLDASAYPVATAVVKLTGGARTELLASGAVEGTAAPGCTVENLGAGLCQVTDGQAQPVSCAQR